MDAIDDRVGDRVAAESETKVVRGTHEHVLQLSGDLVVNLIQAEVQVLELWAAHQEPIRDLVALGVPSYLALDRIEDGNGLFWLLLLLELFVLLDDCIALLELTLVRFDLIGREWNSAKAFKDWKQVISRQAVFGKAEELEGAILFEDGCELLYAGAAEVVVGEVKHLEVAIHGQLSVRLQRLHDVPQVNVLEPAGTHENYLKFLALGDNFGEERDLLLLVVLAWGLDLVGLVRAGGDRITSLEFFSVDWIPV